MQIHKNSCKLGLLALLLMSLTACLNAAASPEAIAAAVEREAALAISRDRCTAIAVSPAASVDGSTMTTHTDDCYECDWRFNKVPAADWPEGALRPVYLVNVLYPRQLREDRGFTWSEANLDAGAGLEGITYTEKGSTDLDANGGRERVDVAAAIDKALEGKHSPVGSNARSTDEQVRVAALRDAWKLRAGKEVLGYIPQVAHTYALIEGNYGIMNEHQVSIGESTCAAKLFAAPLGHSSKPSDPTYPLGKALLEMSELTQLGLERGKTAREAIEVMGALAEKYGFYGADWSIEEGTGGAMGEGGEAVTVVDPTEAWVFHILPDPTGASAIWCAQRVPDGHVAAVANMFVIRDVVEGSPDFLYSGNMHDVAENMGWWKRSDGAPLNFVHAFSPQRYHPSYAHRRIWRVFTKFAPNIDIPPVANAYADEYPFSVAVEPGHKISVADMMDIQRDHYEGTPVSLIEGMAAGPFGDPNRYDAAPVDGMTQHEVIQGEFPRAISLFRTSYSVVANPRANKDDALSLVWLAQYAPDIAAYTPMYVGAETLPPAWTTGNMHRYDSSVAWWNFNSVGNYAAKWYKFAIVSIRQVQADLLHHALAGQKEVEAKVEALLKSNKRALSKKGKHHQHNDDDNTDDDDSDVSKTSSSISALLTTFTVQQGQAVSDAYRHLFALMLTKFRDGLVVGDLDQPHVSFSKKFYPKWWLQAVGYFDAKPNMDPSAIMFAATPEHIQQEVQGQVQRHEPVQEDIDVYTTSSTAASKATAAAAAPATSTSSAGVYLVTMLLTLIVGAAAGYTFARASEHGSGGGVLGLHLGGGYGFGLGGNKHAYEPISGRDDADFSMMPFSASRSAARSGAGAGEV